MLTEKLEQFLRARPNSPFLALDLDVVETKYRELQMHFPQAAVHYAVKANPAQEVIARLAALGSSFDIASRYELDLCLSLGISAEHLSYGNTIKKSADIAHAFAMGVRLFAFDSEVELEKLARHAPGSRVICRVLTSGKSADWPLSRKFGCDPEMACELLLRSRDVGLKPAGVCFHVGSQQTDPLQWETPLRETAVLYRELALHGIQPDLVNIGGGFPAGYRGEIKPLSCYAAVIHQVLRDAFGDAPPQLMLEPGRSLVADAGLIQTEVVLIAQKSKRDPLRWVYLDVGKFGGLAETMDECIKYRLRTSSDGAVGPVVLAGPTCDSADILYEKALYELPLSLAVGDRVEILSAGAYTSSYSSVGFNGFPPLRSYCL